MLTTYLLFFVTYGGTETCIPKKDLEICERDKQSVMATYSGLMTEPICKPKEGFEPEQHGPKLPESEA